MDLMLAVFEIIQGITETIMDTVGIGNASQTVLPQELSTQLEIVDFLKVSLYGLSRF